jgi:hypothetical protein
MLRVVSLAILIAVALAGGVAIAAAILSVFLYSA